MCKKCEFYLVSIISVNLILKKQHLPKFVFFFLHCLITYSVLTAPYTRTKLHKERDYFYFTHYCISSSLQSTGHILFVYIFLCWTLLNKQYMNQNLLVWQQIYIFLNQIDITTLAEILERGKKNPSEPHVYFFAILSCIFHTCTSITESKLSTILYLSKCL